LQISLLFKITGEISSFVTNEFCAFIQQGPHIDLILPERWMDGWITLPYGLSLKGRRWQVKNNFNSSNIYLYIFIMKVVHEVQETKQKKRKRSAKRCKVLVCAQANNELFNVTESKVI